MEKEKLFLYYLFGALYRNGCMKIDIKTNKLFLEYLKSMLSNCDIEKIKALFECDENGIYYNYLGLLNSFDELFAKRNGDTLEFVMDDELSSLFNDDYINYIGEKMAIYVKMKERDR